MLIKKRIVKCLVNHDIEHIVPKLCALKQIREGKMYVKKWTKSSTRCVLILGRVGCERVSQILFSTSSTWLNLDQVCKLVPKKCSSSP